VEAADGNGDRIVDMSTDRLCFLKTSSLSVSRCGGTA
jgi:hypothetical protein